MSEKAYYDVALKYLCQKTIRPLLEMIHSREYLIVHRVPFSIPTGVQLKISHLNLNYVKRYVNCPKILSSDPTIQSNIWIFLCVVAKALSYGLEVNEFKLQSRY